MDEYLLINSANNINSNTCTYLIRREYLLGCDILFFKRITGPCASYNNNAKHRLKKTQPLIANTLKSYEIQRLFNFKCQRYVTITIIGFFCGPINILGLTIKLGILHQG